MPSREVISFNGSAREPPLDFRAMRRATTTVSSYCLDILGLGALVGAWEMDRRMVLVGCLGRLDWYCCCVVVVGWNGCVILE